VIDRYQLPPWFSVFDFPNPNQHSDRRFQTTVSQQALFFLNSPFVLTQAERVAEKAAALARDQNGDPLTLLYRLILQRNPDAGEATAARQLLEEITTPAGPWRYEMARWPGGENRELQQLQPLPVFADNVWRTGRDFPEKGDLGYLCLRAGSGHPGNGTLAAVTAWNAPSAGTWEAVVDIEIPDTNSNGIVLLAAVESRVVWQKEIPPGPVSTHTIPLPTEGPASLRFAVANNGSATCDSFHWNIRLRQAGGGFVADQREDFRGGPTVNGLAVLAQSLLASNEFYFRP
jgi:hypothetical protein